MDRHVTRSSLRLQVSWKVELVANMQKKKELAVYKLTFNVIFIIVRLDFYCFEIFRTFFLSLCLSPLRKSV